MAHSIIATIRIAALLAAGVATTAIAADPAKIDLAMAVKEFQLPESSRPVKELVPGWAAPKKLVVVVDKPERTAWLQEAMPQGVSVVGVRRDQEAAAQMADADALVEVNCVIAVGNARKLRWVHASSGGGDTCLAVQAVASGEAVLTNSQKVKNTALAEMGMGYVFALARSPWT